MQMSSVYNFLYSVHIKKKEPLAFDSLREKVVLSLQHIF